MPSSYTPAGGGGSTPSLAAVLAAGADGGSVDVTNLGGLQLAAGKYITYPNDAGVPMDTTTPANWIRVTIGGSTYEVPAYQ